MTEAEKAVLRGAEIKLFGGNQALDENEKLIVQRYKRCLLASKADAWRVWGPPPPEEREMTEQGSPTNRIEPTDFWQKMEATFRKAMAPETDMEKRQRMIHASEARRSVAVNAFQKQVDAITKRPLLPNIR